MKSRKYIVSLLILISTLPSQAEDYEQSIKLKAENCFDYMQPFTSYGIQYEIYPTDKFSVSYSVQIGYVPDHGIYFQTGAAQSLGFLLMLMEDGYNDFDDYLGVAGFICFILPNELSYTMNQKGRTALRSYIKPINTEFFPFNTSTVYKSFDLSTEFGLKLRLQPGSFLEIVPQIGMKRFYFSKRNALIVGISAGIRF